MNKILYCFIVLVFLIADAWADGVEVEVIKGNTVIPVQNHNVRMLSEEVKMLPAEKQNEINESVQVNANFLFENLSDKNIVMKMGFPFFSSKSNPRDFKAWVQGKPVKAEKRPMGGKGEIVLQHERSGYVLHMYVWNISFAPNEKKEVKVEYRGGWGNFLTPAEHYFIYVTETGALWSGTIGKADIYLKLSRDSMELLKNPHFKLRATPSGYILRRDQLEWHFKNWKPKENIGVVIIDESSSDKSSLGMTNRFSEGVIVTKKDAQPPIPDAMYRCAGYFKTKQRYVANREYYKTVELESWYEDRFSDNDTMPQLCIKALRNEIYARHGKIFTTPEMKQIFESAPWYKPRKDFKEADLNEMEKKNVELILEYEKKMGWK